MDLPDVAKIVPDAVNTVVNKVFKTAINVKNASEELALKKGVLAEYKSELSQLEAESQRPPNSPPLTEEQKIDGDARLKRMIKLNLKITRLNEEIAELEKEIQKNQSNP